MSKIAHDIIELFGNKRLVQLNKLTAGCHAQVLANLEWFNPLGSVKDRIGVAQIRDAEKRGLIDTKTLIVEPTSGNTGIVLAFTCAALGYGLALTMPENMSMERGELLSALGAELILTPADEGMSEAIRKAQEVLQNSPNTFIPT